MRETRLPDPDAIRRLVERIVVSKSFSRSPQLVRFLHFTVEETVQGRGAGLKEYSIATKAFGRREDFDPKVDPIVRVQAGKLRAKLKDYFEIEGRHEPLLIEFPVGAYVPVFRSREPARRPAWQAVSGSRAALALSAVTLVATLLGVVLWTQRDGSPDDGKAVELVQLTFDTGITSNPSVSRDGRLMAFISDRAQYGNVDVWVQPLDGSGQARRLTRDPAQELNPDISPDGRLVVFRSSRDGGIYVVPTSGGEPRKIAVPGGTPRFSPDSEWIAYSARTRTGRTAAFIIPTDEGPPVDLRPDSPHSMFPVWSQDGGHIIYLSASTAEETSFDWWVTPVDRRGGPRIGPAIRTGAAALINAAGLGPVDSVFGPSDWHGNSILFTVSQHNQREIWELPLSQGTYQAAGPPRQVLSGPAVASPRAHQDGGRLLAFFDSVLRLNQIWSLAPSSEPVRLTNDASLLPGVQTRFSLSPNGRYLLFPSKRSGAWRVWQKGLSTGATAAVSQGPSDSHPLYAPGGLKFAFIRETDRRRELWVNAAGIERKVSDDCGRPAGWTPDESAVLCIGDRSLWRVEAASGIRTPLLRRQGWTAMEASLSPLGNWMALSVDQGKQKIQAYLTPFGPAGLADLSAWKWMAEEPFNLTLAWSTDGSRIYYFHSRDGFRCLWSQRVENILRGQAGAPPESVRHFHSYQDYPLNGSMIAVGGNRLAVILAQHRSNLWRAAVPLLEE
jgi:Tol biopolymer transport system component